MASFSNPQRPKSGNVRRASSKQRHRSDLDVQGVSVRARHAVRIRKEKFYGFSSKLILILGALSALYFGGRKAISSLLVHNPDYNVAELNVETDGVLAPEAILESADIQKGSNIFFVNLDRARTRLEAMPEVEKAQVSRQLPSRINIQINERKPVAWIAPQHAPAARDAVVASTASQLIDTHGILLPAHSAQPQDRHLPIIRNYAGSKRGDGEQADGEEIKAALELLHAHQESEISARFQIEEIDLAKQFGLQVTDRNGLQVLFGLDEMERQLKRLKDDLQVLDESPVKPQSINLLVQKNVPVTFVTELVATEQTAPPVPGPTVAATSVAKPATTSSKGKSAASTKGATKGSHPSKSSDKKGHDLKSKRGPQPFGATP